MRINARNGLDRYLLALPPTRQANAANAALAEHVLVAAQDRGDMRDLEVGLFFARVMDPGD